MNNIRETVIACIKDLCPEAAEIEVTDECDPECDLGLTSLMGAELAYDFCIRLEVEIAPEDNPLVCVDSKTGRRRLRKVGEIVDYLSTLPTKTRMPSNVSNTR